MDPQVEISDSLRILLEESMLDILDEIGDRASFIVIMHYWKEYVKSLCLDTVYQTQCKSEIMELSKLSESSLNELGNEIYGYLS